GARNQYSQERLQLKKLDRQLGLRHLEWAAGELPGHSTQESLKGYQITRTDRREKEIGRHREKKLWNKKRPNGGRSSGERAWKRVRGKAFCRRANYSNEGVLSFSVQYCTRYSVLRSHYLSVPACSLSPQGGESGVEGLEATCWS